LLTQSLESPGGGGRYLPLAKALVRRGYSVVMIALHHNYEQAKERHFTLEGVQVRYVAQMHVKKSGNIKTYFSPLQLVLISFWATVRLFWVSFFTPCDVVYVCKTQPMNGFAAWLLHLFLRKPVILDSDDYEAVNNRFSSKWQQRLVAGFEDWMPKFAAGITVGNSFIAQRFKEIGYPADQITLMPHGVERTFFELDSNGLSARMAHLKRTWNIEENHRVIVYVGSMSLVSHAVDLLIEAFSLVVEKHEDALLLMVGSGEDFVRLQQLAERMQLQEHIRFVGRVPIDEVVYYFQMGELSVDPLRRTLPAESSLSLKLLESIAAGVPCVTTDIGDRKEIVQAAGIAVPPGDARQLAEGILQILEQPELATAMRKAALLQRENNWWDRRVDLLIDQFSRLPVR
jgi:glycosyltransferase involved in cell wall biosynthesis